MIAEFRTFLAVVRHGNFSAAGDIIGLTQSAVSSQIRRLEEHFGYALFERTGRSSSLNDAGKALVPKIEDLLRQFDGLAHSVEPSAVGKLRIGAITTAQLGILVPAFAAMRAQGQGMNMHIVPGTSIELMDQLDAGMVDAAIIVRPPFGIYSQLVWQPLVYEPYAVIAPAHFEAKGWEQLLQRHPFIRYERGAFGGRLAERFLRKRQLQLNEVAELDDVPSLYALVKAGVGASIAPLTSALFPLADNLRVWTLGEHTFYREVGLLRQRAPREPQLLEKLSIQLQLQAANIDKSMLAVMT